jgi:hypothetical protein
LRGFSQHPDGVPPGDPVHELADSTATRRIEMLIQTMRDATGHAKGQWEDVAHINIVSFTFHEV